MKKFLTLILSLGMLFSLCACGTNTKDITTTTSAETVMQSSAEPRTRTANPVTEKTQTVPGNTLTVNYIDVGRILRTFKIKKNVEVTDNGKIII